MNLLAILLSGFISYVVGEMSESSSQCAITTQISTTTLLVTVPASVTTGAIGTGSTPSPSPLESVLTSYSTVISYVTVPQTVTATPVSDDPGDPAYYFVDVSGTMSWLNGVSPAATYHSLITETLAITVYPYPVSPTATSPNIGPPSSVSSMALTASSLSTPSLAQAQPLTWVDPSLVTATSLRIGGVSTDSASSAFEGQDTSAGVFPGRGQTGWNASTNSSTTLVLLTISGAPVTLTESVLYASLGPASTTHITTVIHSTLDLTETITIGTPSHKGFHATPLVYLATYGKLNATAVAKTLPDTALASFEDPANSTISLHRGDYSPTEVAPEQPLTSSLSGTQSGPYAVDDAILGLATHHVAVPPQNATRGSHLPLDPTQGPRLPRPSGAVYANISSIVGGMNISTAAYVGQSGMAGTSAFGAITPAAIDDGGSLSVATISVVPALSAKTIPADQFSTASSLTGQYISPSSSTAVHLTTGATASVSSYLPSSTLATLFTNTVNSSGPMPSVCGEHGDFVLTWDDEPNFWPTTPVTDPSDAPPVFNPYHHLFFSNGFVYLPPPKEPFQPVSPPRLVLFLTNETGPSDSTNAGLERSGEIGAGDRAPVSAFWFNAYSAYLGCDNEGPDNCTMKISGYKWQNSTKGEVLAHQQNITLPSCIGFKDCKLQHVSFGKEMTGLSGIRIQASVGGEQRMWFMDNLAMGWYNNSCEAGLLRQRSR